MDREDPRSYLTGLEGEQAMREPLGRLSRRSRATVRPTWAATGIPAGAMVAIDGCGGAEIGCKIFWTTKDQCVSYAESRAGGYWYAAGGGSSEEQATQNAVRLCQSGTAPANTCESIIAECR